MKIYRSLRSREGGFTPIEIILAIVVLIGIGFAVWKAYDLQQTRADQQNRTSQNAQDEKNGDKASKLSSSPSPAAGQASPGSTASSSTPKPATAATPKPSAVTGSTPTPAPVWNIVNPTAGTCPAGSTKTVYSAVAGGAPIYNYDIDNSNQIVGYLPYKTAQTGTCYITAGKGWIQYGGSSYPNARYLRFQDVSITAP